MEKGFSMTLDEYRFKGLRDKLVQLLVQKGITDNNVLTAIGEVPRHKFVESGLEEYAYLDKPLPIPAGQTISQPYTVAFQTQLLEVKRGEKILEIGTGSGYQAAILAHMGAIVYSLERQKELYIFSQIRLSDLGYNVKVFYGDGYQGKPSYAPFNKIIITCGAPYLPEDLKNQVAIGGYIVVPMDDGNSQVMKRFIRVSENRFDEEDHGRFSFVPMVKGLE